jgi:AraC family L-rhamnose operon regulatory protein RhaS
MPSPAYKESGHLYLADTCAPLVVAAQSGKLQLCVLSRGQYPGTRLPAKTLAGLRSAGFWDAEHDQDWGLAVHRNEGIEIAFQATGHNTFALLDTEYPLRPGDLTVTRPWQPHRIGNPNVATGRLYWLIIDVGVRRPHQDWQWPAWLVLTEDDRRELTEALRHNEQAVWHATSEVRQCFQRIGQIIESPSALQSASLLTVHINELFVVLLQMFRRGELPLDISLSSPLRTVELFWEEMRANPALLGSEWTLEELARRCEMGVTRFCQLTRQLKNVSPMQYLSACRVEAACRLLRSNPGRSVTSIALDCGFSSTQHFCNVFRRQVGCTPQVYRAGRQGPP